MNAKISKDSEGRVSPGDKLRITAATFNQILESAQAHKRRKYDSGASTPTSTVNPNITVMLQNKLSSALGIFDCVKIGGDVQLLDSPYDIRYRPGILGVEVTSPDDPIAIVQNFLEPDEMDVAVVLGFTAGYVRMNNSSHTWANPIPGEPAFLESVSCDGQIRILDTFPISESGFPSGVHLALLNIIGNARCTPDLSGSVESGAHVLDVVTKICLNPESGVGIRTQYRRLYLPPGIVVGDEFCIDDETGCCVAEQSYPDPMGVEGCEELCGTGSTWWDAWHAFIPGFTGGPSDVHRNQTVIMTFIGLAGAPDYGNWFTLSCADIEGGTDPYVDGWAIGFVIGSSPGKIGLHAVAGGIQYEMLVADFNCDGPNTLTKVVDSYGTDLPSTLTVYPGYP